MTNKNICKKCGCMFYVATKTHLEFCSHCHKYKYAREYDKYRPRCVICEKIIFDDVEDTVCNICSHKLFDSPEKTKYEDKKTSIFGFKHNKKSKYPIIKCFEYGGIQLRFWCVFCKMFHTHGRCDTFFGAGDGHRSPHCKNDNKFFKDGYILKECEKEAQNEK